MVHDGILILMLILNDAQPFYGVEPMCVSVEKHLSSQTMFRINYLVANHRIYITNFKCVSTVSLLVYIMGYDLMSSFGVVYVLVYKYNIYHNQ